MITRRSAASYAILLSLLATGCGNSSNTEAVPFVAVDMNSASSTDRAIAAAQASLQADDQDDDARLALAQAFLQKAREIADPTLYSKAEQLLDGLREDGSRGDDGRDVAVLNASGSLALSQHRFDDALGYARDVLQDSPENEAALGIAIDAQNELGRYDEALADTQAMVDVRPSLASLARASYARELRGDTPGAIQAMREAVGIDVSAQGENIAYLQVQLGDLLFKSGQVDAALAEYQAAERSFPGFAASLAGQANVAASRNQIAESLALWERVISIQPLPLYAQLQGDVLTAAGRQAEADRSYALVDTIFDLEAANGVDADFERALYLSDHGASDDGVGLARDALKQRPTIFAYDALAWNLFRVGDFEDAAEESEKALALGSNDPLLRFHAAAIAEANGRIDEAREHLRRVVDGNPRFSVAHAAGVDELRRKLTI